MGERDCTVDDLAGLPEEARYELVDGELVPLDPTPVHQLIVMRAVQALGAGGSRDFLAVHGVPLAVDRHNEPRPDAVLIRLDHVDRSPVPVGDVVVAVEVISPTTRFRNLFAKTKIYAAAGVASCWVVDPWSEDGIELSELRPGPTGDLEVVRSTRQVFTTDVPFPVTLDLPAMTARRRRILAAARPDR